MGVFSRPSFPPDSARESGRRRQRRLDEEMEKVCTRLRFCFWGVVTCLGRAGGGYSFREVGSTERRGMKPVMGKWEGAILQRGP